jgi:hypothetical protein
MASVGLLGATMDAVDWLRSCGLGANGIPTPKNETVVDDVRLLRGQLHGRLGFRSAYCPDARTEIEDCTDAPAASPGAFAKLILQDAGACSSPRVALRDLVDSDALKHDDPFVDPVAEGAMIFSEAMAKAFLREGGNLVELFATFVGMVVQEDDVLGLHCLEELDGWRTILISRR